jgi:hypothetical protein
MHRLTRLSAACVVVLLSCGRDTPRDHFSSAPQALGAPTRALVAVNPGRWAATGSLTAARTSQTATLLTSGKVLIVGGTATAAAELFDPATGVSTATGSPAAARQGHTAVLLQSGKVLVAGGQSGGAATASCEIYDPATGLFTATAPLGTARQNHTAVLLSNGKVLALGGSGSSAPGSAELYDPAAGTWTATFAMVTPGSQQTATVLASGQVLVTGGFDPTGLVTNQTTQIFDPTQNTWSAAGSMAARRTGHTATLLPSGQVLVTGGSNGGSPQNTAELFNSVSLAWTSTPNMGSARTFHSATLLPSGVVLVSGGTSTGSDALATAELFDPGSASWTPAASLGTGRYSHSATLLPSGKLIVAGGSSSPAAALASIELFDPATPIMTATGSMGSNRANATSTLLPSGKVLVAGGFDGANRLASCELYDPAAGTYAATGAMIAARSAHTATPLPSGKVLVAGGFSGTSPLTSAELFDPASGTWAATGALTTARYRATATLLPNGKVLVAGGTDSGGTALSSSELYDPATGAWTSTPALLLGSARDQATATLLPNGKVLVAGGYGAGGAALGTGEIFDPSTGSWAFSSGAMVNARYAHVAALLPSGKVLIASGQKGGVTNRVLLADAELFDPATGTFAAATGILANGRIYASATVLSSGGVLIAGGSSNGALVASEIYEPATGAFSSAASQTVAVQPNATLLLSGAVLLSGGSDASSAPVAAASLFDEGRGASIAATPKLGTVPASASLGKNLTVGGTLFTGISGGSSGSTDDSASNYPLLLLEAVDSGEAAFAPSVSFTATAATVTIPASFPAGEAVLRVVVNGVPSAGAFLTLAAAVQPLALSPATASLAPGAAQTFAASGGTPAYTFSLTTNGSGGTIDAAAGTYVAGRKGGTTDVVTATDSTGAVAMATVTVTAGVSVSPATASVAPRGTQAFTAQGGSGSYTWTLATNGSGGTVDATGLYTAGSTGATTDVVKATDSLGNIATATVTVTAAPLSLSPGTATLPPRGSQTFAATGGTGGYTWTLLPSSGSGGAITAAGVYTAGATGGTTDTVKVTDSASSSATAVVTVTAGLSLSPATVTLAPRASQTFTAAGGSGAGYTWSLATGGSGGAITSAGVYTAGVAGGTTDTVTVADPLGNSATAIVTVTAGVSILPASTTLPPRGSRTFSAGGGSGTGFTWTLATNASGGSVNAASGRYTAGNKGGTTDVVMVADSLGNSATASVGVTAGVSVSPASASVPPRGSQSFAVAGGSGTYAFSLVTNASRGSVNASTGRYSAGSKGGVTDVVKVVDDLGNSATAPVQVTAGVSVSPATWTLAVRTSRVFTASAGNGAGYTWAFATNASGGAIDKDSGRYTAGGTSGVTDVVQATDSLGNIGTAAIVVMEGIAVTPGSASLLPEATVTFSARGGTGRGFVWSMGENPSGATIDASTGQYIAGPTGGVSDVIKVTDSIGTVGTATVTVNPAPPVVRSGGCASADGSAWPQLLAGALALLLRPRRKSAQAA